MFRHCKSNHLSGFHKIIADKIVRFLRKEKPKLCKNL